MSVFSGRWRWWLLTLLIGIVIASVTTLTGPPSWASGFVAVGAQAISSAANTVHSDVSLGVLGVLQGATYIFLHNLKDLVLFAIPAAGPAFFAYSLTITGWSGNYLAINQLHVPAWASLLTLLIMPSTWVEIFAYSIATSESIMLLVGLGRRPAKALKAYAASVALAVAVLLAAAIIESTEIALLG